MTKPPHRMPDTEHTGASWGHGAAGNLFERHVTPRKRPPACDRPWRPTADNARRAATVRSSEPAPGLGAAARWLHSGRKGMWTLRERPPVGHPAVRRAPGRSSADARGHVSFSGLLRRRAPLALRRPFPTGRQPPSTESAVAAVRAAHRNRRGAVARPYKTSPVGGAADHDAAVDGSTRPFPSTETPSSRLSPVSTLRPCRFE